MESEPIREFLQSVVGNPHSDLADADSRLKTLAKLCDPFAIFLLFVAFLTAVASAKEVAKFGAPLR